MSGSASQTAHEVFPEILQGDWFAWQDGRGHQFTIDQSEYEGRGEPLEWNVIAPDVRDYIFRRNACYYCSRFIIRSWNIVERYDGKQSLKLYWQVWDCIVVSADEWSTLYSTLQSTHSIGIYGIIAVIIFLI